MARRAAGDPTRRDRMCAHHQLHQDIICQRKHNHVHEELPKHYKKINTTKLKTQVALCNHQTSADVRTTICGPLMTTVLVAWYMAQTHIPWHRNTRQHMLRRWWGSNHRTQHIRHGEGEREEADHRESIKHHHTHKTHIQDEQEIELLSIISTLKRAN